MDSWYSLTLFIHVTSAMMLAAALGILTICEFKVAGAWTLEELRRWVGLAEKTGKALGIISPMLLVSALYLVHLRWGFGQPWIMMALVTFFVMAISGRVVIGGRLHTILDAAIQEGSVSPQVRAMIGEPLLRWHPWVRIGVFTWLLFLMTSKPGPVGAVVALVAALSVSTVLGQAGRPAEGRPRATGAYQTK